MNEFIINYLPFLDVIQTDKANWAIRLIIFIICAKTFELALLPCYEYTMAIFGILSPFLTFENMLKLCILVALALGSFSSTTHVPFARARSLPYVLLSLCQPGPAKFYLNW